jgi:DNA-binding transcriptional LysR family regulator
MRRDLPPLTALIAFEAAARHLNFTRAASELNVTQPAISHQIHTLETDLGARLFDRNGRRVSLTEIGQTYFNVVSGSLGEIADVTRSIRHIEDSGLVTIAASPGLSAFWLLPRLEMLREEKTDLRVRIVTIDADRDLSLDAVDFAIHFGPGTWPSARCWRMMYEEVTPVCAPGYRNGTAADWTPEAIWADALIQGDEAEPEWFTWDDWRLRWCPETEGAGPRQAVANYSVVLMQAIAGRGIALGWKPMLDDLLAAGTLIKAGDFPLTSDRGYFIIEALGRPIRDEVKFLREWLLGQVGALSPVAVPDMIAGLPQA